jgi:Ubiquitin family
MLCKSKSRGDAKLRMEDRFFIEARCCCCGSDNSTDTDAAATAAAAAAAAAGDRRHYLYFSRLATAGRALDAIAAAVKHAQCESFAHGSDVELIVERTGAALSPLTRALSEFGSELQCYDCVMIAPRGTAAASATAVTSQTDADSVAALAAAAPAGTGITAAGAGAAAVNSVQTAAEHAAPSATQADTATTIAATAAAAVELTALQCTVTVMDGKAAHAVPVSLHAVESDAHGVSTVLQLKRALESLTQVPFTRQKLMLKGKLLKDEQLLVQAGVSSGSKITLLGTAAGAKT